MAFQVQALLRARDLFTFCGNLCAQGSGVLPVATQSCQIPQWNGSSWVATRSPGITEVTVGPTTGFYPDIATALTNGCRVIRAVDTYTDSSDWSLPNFPALAATPAVLIYTDPGIILTLEPPSTIVIPSGFTVTWSGSALETADGESTGSEFRLTSNSPSPFFANGGAFMADTAHINHRTDAPSLSADPSDTSGNLRFQNVGFTLASDFPFVGTVATPSLNIGADFHQCKFLGQNALASIIRSTSQRTVVFSDCHIEGTFGGPPPVPPTLPNAVITLVNDQHRLDGLTTRIDAGTSTAITMGGHIAGIENASGSAFGELFLNPTATRVSEVECAQLILPSFSTVNMILSDITLRDGSNAPSALSFDGRGKVFNNLDCGSLTLSNAGGEPGLQLSNFRVRGTLTVSGDSHNISNGAVDGPTAIAPTNVVWSATNSSLSNCRVDGTFLVSTNNNIFSNLTVTGTVSIVPGINNRFSNCQLNAAVTINSRENRLDNCTLGSTLLIRGISVAPDIADNNTFVGCFVTGLTTIGQASIAPTSSTNNHIVITGCTLQGGLLVLGRSSFAFPDIDDNRHVINGNTIRSSCNISGNNSNYNGNVIDVPNGSTITFIGEHQSFSDNTVLSEDGDLTFEIGNLLGDTIDQCILDANQFGSDVFGSTATVTFVGLASEIQFKNNYVRGSLSLRGGTHHIIGNRVESLLEFQLGIGSDNCLVSDNYCGSLTLRPAVSECAINGNYIGGIMTIDGSENTVNNNKARSAVLSWASTASRIICSGNSFATTTVVGSNHVITGNDFTGTFNFGNNVVATNLCVVSGNRIGTADLRTNGTLLDNSTFSNNVISTIGETTTDGASFAVSRVLLVGNVTPGGTSDTGAGVITRRNINSKGNAIS